MGRPRGEGELAMQERLERAGIRSQREEGVECCYALQTKFWVTDPDQTLWEIYTLEGDLDHRGRGQDLSEMLPHAELAANDSRVIWEHRLGEPVPAALPLADASADEVRLRGTFNLPLTDQAKHRLVAEAGRVLRPGGRLFVHVLVGDQPLARPQLPGPAAAVQHVPLDKEPQRLLESAGFRDLRLLKFDDKPCFLREGVAMREMQLEGRKPAV